MKDPEYKQAKKAWNKGRRKASRPFKGLSALLAVVCVAAAAVSWAFSTFPSTLNLMLGIDTYRVESPDDSAQYYLSEFASDEERSAYEDALVEEVEAEGAVLLKNVGNALPLGEGARVTLFSHSSVEPVYGGTGSGGVDTSSVASLRDGLEGAGLEVNPIMWDFYETGDASGYIRETTSQIALLMGNPVELAANEVPWDVYTDDVLASVADYGDAAVVVLSRIGGEGDDLPLDEEGGYLALSAEERDLLSHLSAMKAEGTIEKIVVLVNTSNALEVDFLFDDAYDVDAALWIGGVGETGVHAVGKILSGAVNPSGHLADTYCKDNMGAPALANFPANTYVNAGEVGLTSSNSSYTVYQEGIYVGYRYYETRYEDVAMGTAGAGDFDYASEVAYPFGYGLSYTDFEWSGFSASYDEAADAFDISVTVTNTGDVAGKDAVQVYAQSPYTDYDRANGIEKASVELAGFAKTKLLEPGESQTVTVNVPRKELACYDAYGAGTYVLDSGTYYLTAAHDAHDAVNNVLAAKGFSPDAGAVMDAMGNAAMAWAWENAELDAESFSTSVTGTAIQNRFDDADINASDVTGDQEVTYLSRSDWEGTWPEGVELEATDSMVAELADRRYDAATYDGEFAGVSMPTTGADNGLKAVDLVGADYDDPRWDQLLDQLTTDEMTYFLGSAFHFTQPVESVGLPGTRDENGPQGLTATLFAGSGIDVSPVALTSEDVLAATFNTELAHEVGRVLGEDCLAAGMTFLYGPAANIHRTPYSGRNFEYYSEDGFLSGQMAAAECSGLESKGAHVMLKHFALNDSETARTGLGVWANEQAIREVYLKAFEAAFTEGDACGVMSSYTRVGCHWAGADEGLISGVLRGEWGCNGVVISDNSNFSSYYMDGVDSVLAGGDLFDAMCEIEYHQLAEYVDDPVVVSAMRESCHRVMYAIVNSLAMNGMGTDSAISLTLTPGPVATVVAWVSGIGCVACIALVVVRGRAYRKANPKPRRTKA